MTYRYETAYWNDRYNRGGNSGYGSYGDQMTQKVNWITPLDFETVTEVGCGDFNFGSHILLNHPAQYLGLDISEVVIDHNREIYPGRQRFQIFNGEIPPADLLMCVDVLFHIINDEELELMLDKLEKAWTKYLVITAYERDEEFHNHVRIRKFDYKRFGEPILREVIEEDGSLYFYIFKKNDRPIPSERVSHHERLNLPTGNHSSREPISFRGVTYTAELRKSLRQA